jgi:hypothetical protein
VKAYKKELFVGHFFFKYYLSLWIYTIIYLYIYCIPTNSISKVILKENIKQKQQKKNKFVSKTCLFIYLFFVALFVVVVVVVVVVVIIMMMGGFILFFYSSQLYIFKI